MQALQDNYFAAYGNLKLTRDAKGILVVQFHSDGGAFIMTARAHTEFVDAFYRIAQDRANKIVILTGAFERAHRARGWLRAVARRSVGSRSCEIEKITANRNTERKYQGAGYRGKKGAHFLLFDLH